MRGNEVEWCTEDVLRREGMPRAGCDERGILFAALQLLEFGATSASATQCLAGALLISRPDLLPLPQGHIVEAFEDIGEKWQCLLIAMHREYGGLLRSLPSFDRR